MFTCIYIPNASGDAHGALIDCASTFSPRLEVRSAGMVVFDIEGLERLFGSYSEIATKVANDVRVRGLEANVAIASNADAAICAARGFGGVTVLNNGSEAKRLQELPLSVLFSSPEILETLERWGIRTLGAFAKLPVVDVSERLGQEGVRLHKLARGAGSRPLVTHVATVRFVEVIDLDYEIATIEPLAFILSRMLDAICARLQARNLATHEVHLSLGTSVRVLNLPLPVRNPKLLMKLLILDLEARPPGIAVRRLEVEAIPAKPRVVQNGLFVPLSPEPEKLELTLARLKAVVGEENVGTAEISDTHRPDAFRIKPFGVVNEYGAATYSPPRRGGVDATSKKYRAATLKGADGVVRPAKSCIAADLTTLEASRSAHSPLLCEEGNVPHTTISTYSTSSNIYPSIVLRRFRPPLDATVQLRNNLPIWIAFHGVHGPIATTSGPWHTSGDWWRPTMWEREEWDIEVLDALYRIYYDVHVDRWYAEGVYD
jgi:protein ImuB